MHEDVNRTMEKLAGEYRVTPDAIAYAWLLRYPAKMQVIIGTMNPAHIATAAEAAEVHLSREEWYELYTWAGNMLP